MRTQELYKTNSKLLNSSFSLLVLFCIILYGLAIFQDYVFSKIQITGFYWSDTMLYNTYWLLFIPFIKIANSFYDKIQPKSTTNKIFYALCTGFVFSLLHIFLFTSVFILASNIIFPVPHRFSRIFKNAISNQLYITIIAYLFSPFIFDYLKRKAQITIQKNIKTLTVKNGVRRIKIDISTVLFIKTDRPYTMIYANNQKFLHDESLKKLEKLLDPQTFIRVHRSVIANKNHITELKSRKNGDYDCILTNGQSIRLSRHYRQNWNELLNH
ncbi:LytR/AlgR family response regulator transcription factor [Aquimarina aquimarini]|uniref:LytR/AlgR family response regulator transcription factor n=1 Tax=Aquimarina aquimarini TaxID=1191734 RepID=UPI000D55A10D|nr:LytTR family DNA-binding domain-containing protein [Aquimarina aquimarini]